MRKVAVLNGFAKENIVKMFLLVVILTIGISIGCIVCKYVDSEEQLQINNMISNWKESNVEINKIQIIKSNIFNNIKYVIALTFLGLTILSTPIIYLIIGLKGFVIGFTIMNLLKIYTGIKGILIIGGLFGIQILFIIPLIIILAIHSINSSKKLSDYKNRENLYTRLCNNSVIGIIFCLIITVLSIAEIYIQLLIMKI